MEVNPGYKQTVVGVIPEDWVVKQLAQLADIHSGGTPSTTQPQFWDGDILWCTPTDITGLNGGKYLSDTSRKISIQGLRSSSAEMIPANSVVMTSRATIGECAINRVAVSTNQGFKNFVPFESVDVEFLYYLLFTQKQGFISLCGGSTFLEIGKSQLAAFAVPLPPTKAEQEAIAEALSDADALIESLEQLLAKKRQLKQGAMQELLRPKLSEEVRLLGDVSSLKGRIGWQGLKQAEFTTNDDEPFLITGMNFKDGAIRWSEVYHISEARYEMAPEIQLRPNDVLMTKDGTIGKVLYIDTIPYPGKASLNSHLLLFRPIKAGYNPRYLYYQLGSRRFKNFVELNKSGTTFFGLSQAAVAAYPVLLPPLEEQVRIATILSDMDVEITALEGKLAKARNLKQGMMQELLTGRIRLV